MLTSRPVAAMLIVTLALAILAGLLAGEAQQAGKVRRIGVLYLGYPAVAPTPSTEAFQRASWAGWRART